MFPAVLFVGTLAPYSGVNIAQKVPHAIHPHDPYQDVLYTKPNLSHPTFTTWKEIHDLSSWAKNREVIKIGTNCDTPCISTVRQWLMIYSITRCLSNCMKTLWDVKPDTIDTIEPDQILLNEFTNRTFELRFFIESGQVNSFIIAQRNCMAVFNQLYWLH